MVGQSLCVVTALLSWCCSLPAMRSNGLPSHLFVKGPSRSSLPCLMCPRRLQCNLHPSGGLCVWAAARGLGTVGLGRDGMMLKAVGGQEEDMHASTGCAHGVATLFASVSSRSVCIHDRGGASRGAGRPMLAALSACTARQRTACTVLHSVCIWRHPRVRTLALGEDEDSLHVDTISPTVMEARSQRSGTP